MLNYPKEESKGGVEWCSLIDPEDYFDPINIYIHGITETDVAGAPKTNEVA